MPVPCEERPAPDGPPAPSVGSAAASDIRDALRKLGVPVDSAARRLGLDFAHPGRSVPSSAILQLFEDLAEQTGDPLLGLHTGEAAEPRGPLDHLLMSCPSLEDALLRCRRFGPLLVSSMRIDVERDGGRFVVAYDLGDSALTSRHFDDYCMMATARSLRRATGEEFGILEVHLRYEDDAHRTAVERAFGCPARFGEPVDRLVIPVSAVTRSGRMSNPLIAEQIERFAEALLPREAAPSTFTEQVTRAARTLLSSGVRAERRGICRQLGVSERTLHRRLAEEGANFRAVREKVLWDLAEALVAESDLKLEAVALSVGFNDAAAFSKAFKRRAGCSPIEYRRARA